MENTMNFYISDFQICNKHTATVTPFYPNNFKLQENSRSLRGMPVIYQV
jgi:hypothetical protein